MRTIYSDLFSKSCEVAFVYSYVLADCEIITLLARDAYRIIKKTLEEFSVV